MRNVSDATLARFSAPPVIVSILWMRLLETEDNAYEIGTPAFQPSTPWRHPGITRGQRAGNGQGKESCINSIIFPRTLERSPVWVADGAFSIVLSISISARRSQRSKMRKDNYQFPSIDNQTSSNEQYSNLVIFWSLLFGY